MSRRRIITVSLATAVAAGLIVYWMKKNQKQKREIRIAEAGYETAYDVLYPLRSTRVRR